MSDMYGFIKIAGVTGEALEQNHKGWTEVDYFDLKLTLPQNPGASGGGARSLGDVVFNRFVVRKRLEKSSPDLFLACCQGKVFGDVTFERLIKTGGETAEPAFTVKLENATIAGFEPFGEWEQLEFTFAKIEYSRTSFGPDGRSEGTNPRHWDLTTNKGG